MDHVHKNNNKISVKYIVVDDNEYFYDKNSKLLYSVNKPHTILGKYDNYKIKHIILRK